MEELLYLMAKHRTRVLRRQSQAAFPSLPCIQFRSTQQRPGENESRVVSRSSFFPEV